MFPSSSPTRIPVFFDAIHLYRTFLDNVATMDDHSYRIDEIFRMFPVWQNARGAVERSYVVEDLINPLFEKDAEQSADWDILFQAVRDLYEGVERLFEGQSVCVIDAAYYEDTDCLELTLSGNPRDGLDHPRIRSSG